MDMMGINSSQPATQTQVAGTQSGVLDNMATANDRGVEHTDASNTHADGGDAVMTPLAKSRRSGEGRSTRKLKKYSGKKRLSSGKTKAAVFALDAQQSSPARASPEIGEAHTSQSKPAKKQKQRASLQNATQSSPELGRGRVDDADADSGAVASTPSNQLDATQSSRLDAADAQHVRHNSTSTRRERVSRNRVFLDSIRKPKSKRTSQEDQVEEEEEDATKEAPSAQSNTEQMQDSLKVSAWLDHESGTAPATSTANGNGYGATLNQAEAEAREEAAAQDEEEEHDAPREYEVPSGSDNDYQPPTQASTKRKRDSAPTTPAPVKKRQRKSALAVTTPPRDAQPTATVPRPAADPVNFPSAGNFTPMEIELVERAFDETRAGFGLSRMEMIYRIQASAAEVGPLLTTLTQDVLPNRNRKAIQRFCRRHFNDAVRGKWTDEQDELLSTAYAENPNRWVYIGQIVGRTPEDCRDRWRNFVSLGASRHTDVWTRDEELTLCKAIRDSIAIARKMQEEEITPEREDEFISWNSVIEKMGGLRNRLQCTNKWKKIRSRTGQQAQVEDFVSDKEKRAEKAASKKRFKDLTMGDIHAMMTEIQYACFIGRLDHGPTFWGVVTKMHPSSPYTTADRKHAYRRMRGVITDTGDFVSNITAIIQEIKTEFADKIHTRTLLDDPNKAKSGPLRNAVKNYPSAERIQESDDDDADEGDVTGVTLESDVGAGAANDAAANAQLAGSQPEGEVAGVSAAEQAEVPNSPHVSESEYDEE